MLGYDLEITDKYIVKVFYDNDICIRQCSFNKKFLIFILPVHNLDLNNCKNITDISGLGNVHLIIIFILQVHTLNLTGCKNIRTK